MRARTRRVCNKEGMFSRMYMTCVTVHTRWLDKNLKNGNILRNLLLNERKAAKVVEGRKN